MSATVILSEQARRYHPDSIGVFDMHSWCKWYLANTHVPTTLLVRASIAIYQLGQHMRWRDAHNGYKDYQSVMSGAMHWYMAGMQLDRDTLFTSNMIISHNPFNPRECGVQINYEKLYALTAHIIQMIIDLQRPFTHTRKARFSSQQAIDIVLEMVTMLSSYVPHRVRFTCIRGECEVMAGKL